MDRPSQQPKASWSHIQLNVTNQNLSRDFYLRVLVPLGFVLADEQEGQYARLTNGIDVILVLCQTEERFLNAPYHRKRVGLGHLALSVASRADIDRMEHHLAALGIALRGEGKTETGYRKGYYCLLFEDPDRIMIELVFHDAYYFSTDPNPRWA